MGAVALLAFLYLFFIDLGLLPQDEEVHNNKRVRSFLRIDSY
jgi:hypothetical protein